MYVCMYICVLVCGVRLKLAEEGDVVYVEQGSTFSISFHVMDEEGMLADLGQWLLPLV